MWKDCKLNWTSEDYYNAEDLNRVESNTIEVSNLVRELVGVNVDLENSIANRDYSTIEFSDSLNRVERNLEKLSVLSLEGLKTLKTNWQIGDKFDYRDAIRLENNLHILYNILSKNKTNISYCGEINCGGEAI